MCCFERAKPRSVCAANQKNGSHTCMHWPMSGPTEDAPKQAGLAKADHGTKTGLWRNRGAQAGLSSSTRRLHRVPHCRPCQAHDPMIRPITTRFHVQLCVSKFPRSHDPAHGNIGNTKWDEESADLETLETQSRTKSGIETLETQSPTRSSMVRKSQL